LGLAFFAWCLVSCRSGEVSGQQDAGTNSGGITVWSDIEKKIDSMDRGDENEQAMRHVYEGLLDRVELQTPDGRSAISYAVYRHCAKKRSIELQKSTGTLIGHDVLEICFTEYLDLLAEREETDAIMAIVKMAPKDYVEHRVIWSVLKKHDTQDRIRNLAELLADTTGYCVDFLKYAKDPNKCLRDAAAHNRGMFKEFWIDNYFSERRSEAMGFIERLKSSGAIVVDKSGEPHACCELLDNKIVEGRLGPR